MIHTCVIYLFLFKEKPQLRKLLKDYNLLETPKESALPNDRVIPSLLAFTVAALWFFRAGAACLPAQPPYLQLLLTDPSLFLLL